MKSLDRAVASTLKYSTFFHFPLDDRKLHLWLISDQIVPIDDLIKGYPQKLSTSQQNYLHQSRQISLQKIQLHQSLLNFLNRVPTILGVFVTGSVSVDNARVGDDLDLMIVTRRHSLWLTRFFLIPVLKIKYNLRSPHETRQLSDLVCLNLWLDEGSLQVPQTLQSLYTAHEVLQTRPLIDKNSIHQHFLSSNSWTSRYLANAYYQLSDHLPRQTQSSLLNLIFFLPNFLLYLFQYLYMQRHKTREFTSLSQAYFHPNSPNKAILEP